jgi:hypothetical protein
MVPVNDDVFRKSMVNYGQLQRAEFFGQFFGFAMIPRLPAKAGLMFFSIPHKLTRFLSVMCRISILCDG